jgi:hypothetical protein
MEQVTRSQFQRWKYARGRSRRYPAILLAVVAGLISPFSCQGADEPLEYQVKAAFLLNFTRFIEWPSEAFENARSPLAICILGDDPFGDTLNQLVKGETVNGRKLVVQRIRRAPPPKSCQVLFVSTSEKDLPKILTGLGPGVLSVGEADGFLRDGGMIAFVIENRRVRFDINQSAAANASLTMSARLLNVARSVQR